MFDGELFCDFHLRMMDGETLKASKLILSARSPVFLKMLTTDMEEASTNSVDIPDVDSQTMKELLRFIYCYKVQELNEVVSDLLIAADKYQIAELKTICVDHITENLSQDNVVDVLVMTDPMSDVDKMFACCINVVAL